jgi:hypothetical protein
MSHNVQISGIKINNLDALDTACRELKREGIDVWLDRGAPGERSKVFRTYSGFGNNPNADSVIRIPGAPYDIGLLRQEAGHYEAIYDNMLGISMPCPIACQFVPGEKHDGSQGHAMGKLMQRYSSIVAEMDARRRGLLARRVVQSNGDIEVVITC